MTCTTRRPSVVLYATTTHENPKEHTIIFGEQGNTVVVIREPAIPQDNERQGNPGKVAETTKLA